MFARLGGAGSLYWPRARDRTGTYLDGGRSYRLRSQVELCVDKLGDASTVDLYCVRS